jgi:hypothetical protein
MTQASRAVELVVNLVVTATSIRHLVALNAPVFSVAASRYLTS